jgi:hypothetical protein
MFLNLLFWSLMTTTAMTTSPTPSTPIAQMQNQSVTSTTPSEAVRVATNNSAFWFKWYVGWAVFAVLVSVFLTWMVWRSGNLLQEAAVADANKAAGDANKAAGEANERAAKLEKEAVALQLELVEVRRKQQRRTIDGEKFIAALKGKPRCEIEVVYQPNDDEAAALAKLIALYSGALDFIPIPTEMGVKSVYLGQDGKPLPKETQDFLRERARSLPPTVRAGAIGALNASNKPGYAPTGIFLAINKRLSGSGAAPLPVIDPNTAFGAIVYALAAVGLPPSQGYDPDLPDNKIRIIVGSRP